MSSLTSGLNPEQLKAVTLPRQCALILAGAGSGKTRVLTTRIAHLIQSGEVSPAGVLAVTFTNKAAREMLMRLSAMLPINTRGMWGGNFHGLCNRLVRAPPSDEDRPLSAFAGTWTEFHGDRRAKRFGRQVESATGQQDVSSQRSERAQPDRAGDRCPGDWRLP
jgi:superfamily I DNA/RNA helicase